MPTPPPIPDDLPTDPADSYRRGWTDHARSLQRAGGSANTEAQRAARRANGAAPVKPGSRPRGRPRKQPDVNGQQWEVGPDSAEPTDP